MRLKDSVLRFIFVIYGGLLLTSCSAREPQANTLNTQLSAYMLAEIALNRQQHKQAYAYINDITQSPTTTELYAKLTSLLKNKKHDSFRYQLISKWQQQFPEDTQANLYLAREHVCQNDDNKLAIVIKTLQLDQTPSTIDKVLSCLDAETKGLVLRQIIKEAPDLKQVQLSICDSLVESKQDAEALLCFQNLDSIPDPTTLKTLAELHQKAGNIEQAKAIYTTLIEINPLDITARYALVEIFYDESDFENAITELVFLNRQAPKNRNYQYLLAASHYAQRDFEESRFWFEQILVSKQYRNIALYYLGLIAIEMNEFETAKVLLLSVKESDEYLPAQLNYWRLISKEDLDKAINGLYNLLDSAPEERMTIKLTQIDLYDKANDTQRATQELVSLADDYPTNLRLQILRVQWLIDRDYIDRVDANLQASLVGLQQFNEKIQLVSSTLYHLIAQHYGNMALELLERQTVIEKNSDDYLFLAGLSNAIAEKYPAAINNLEQILEKYPERHDIKNALGYALTLQGKDFVRAEQLITEALTMYPSSASYLDSMGWLRFNQGDFTAAEEYLVNANTLSSDPAIKAHLIEVYLAQGRAEEAQELLSEAQAEFPQNRILKQLILRLFGSIKTTIND